jgi:cell division septal protein FtsQ
MSVTRTLSRRRRLGATLGSPATGQRRAAPRRPRLRPRLRLAMAATVVLAGLLFGAWMWVRDSSLVGVDQVTIRGASGAEATAIRSALRASARNMTTLDVHMN